MSAERDKLYILIREAVERAVCDGMRVVPVGVSNKHIHLSRREMDLLFGRGTELTVRKKLSQPGVFAAEECLEVVGPKGSFDKVRILGPLREEAQVELAMTDCIRIGVHAPIRASGDLKGTPGIVLKGPCGIVELEKGVIVAARHLHLSVDEARYLGLHDGDYVDIAVDGPKPGVMEQVLVRAGMKHAMDLHIDTDDANAFALKSGSLVRII